MAIHISHVTLTRGEKTILRDINWAIPTGACAAILGPNGSGKSTLVRVIMGQMWPSTGQVSVLGISSVKPTSTTPTIHPPGTNRRPRRIRCRRIHPAHRPHGFFGTVGLFKQPPPKCANAPTH